MLNAGSLKNASSLLQSFLSIWECPSDKVLWSTLCKVNWASSKEGINAYWIIDGQILILQLFDIWEEKKKLSTESIKQVI